MVKLCATLTESECDQILAKYPSDDDGRIDATAGFSYLGSSMAFVLKTMDRCRHLRVNTLPGTTDDVVFASTSNASTSASTTAQTEINLNLLEQQLQKLCLPFLRIAALLRHHLYEQPLPDIHGPHVEFVCLVYYLELVTVDIDWNGFSASEALCFLPGLERSLPELWCRQLMEIRSADDSSEFDKSIGTLVSSQHMLFMQPGLLRLPREYEKLFTVSDDELMPFGLKRYLIFVVVSSSITRDPAPNVMKRHENAPFACYAVRLYA